MREGPQGKSDAWWRIHLMFCEQCRHTVAGQEYLARQPAPVMAKATGERSGETK